MSEDNDSIAEMIVENIPLTLGQKLTQAREILGLSVGEVAERLKLSARQIEALEKDDYSNLPEDVFVRGFLRSYSRLLNLDENNIIADLDSVLPKLKEELKFESPVGKTLLPKGAPKITAKIIGFGLLVVIIVVILFQLFSNSKNTLGNDVAIGELVSPDVAYPEEVVSETTQGNIISQENIPPQNILTEAASLTISLSYRSNLKVLDANGNKLIDQVVPGKSEHKIEGNGPFTVRIGYAKGATVLYDNQIVDIASETHNNTAEFIVPKQP